MFTFKRGWANITRIVAKLFCLLCISLSQPAGLGVSEVRRAAVLRFDSSNAMLHLLMSPEHYSAFFRLLAGHGSLKSHVGPAGRRHAPVVARSDSHSGSYRRVTRRGNANTAAGTNGTNRTDGTTTGTRIRDRRVGVAEGTAERCESHLTESTACLCYKDRRLNVV
jgi:hypothetical protein